MKSPFSCFWWHFLLLLPSAAFHGAASFSGYIELGSLRLLLVASFGCQLQMLAADGFSLFFHGMIKAGMPLISFWLVPFCWTLLRSMVADAGLAGAALLLHMLQYAELVSASVGAVAITIHDFSLLMQSTFVAEIRYDLDVGAGNSDEMVGLADGSAVVAPIAVCESGLVDIYGAARASANLLVSLVACGPSDDPIPMRLPDPGVTGDSLPVNHVFMPSKLGPADGPSLALADQHSQASANLWAPLDVCGPPYVPIPRR
ncbi:hypothetical protein Nepgr_004021 [Nepenthes gracilis]|uniref:Uncharacterized protein n=1 Tax=Nepenthes gracilis TaxID=150966 RepID=A0AAD3S0T7_NEPGR|nr:hypothetical protein Nepgr_004021 [Nepenthes gracilis]